jgi:hypothetical protein
VIQLDANAKLGSDIIQNDPHKITENGEILLDIMTRQNLSVVNGMDLCEGVVTRERITKNRIERSVIDFILVCEVMKEFVKRMFIDEDRIHVLTKYAGKSGLKKHVKSDHNILVSKFSILVEDKLPALRREIYQFKCYEDQRKFFQETSSTDKLSGSFSKNQTFAHNANIFFKNLKSCIHKSFKKVRNKKGGPIPKLGNPLIQENMKLKTNLKIFLKSNKCKLGDVIAKAELEAVETFLTETCATRNAELIKNHLGEMESIEGKFCQVNLWKLKNKLCPKPSDPPMGKKDELGMLITAPNLLKELYMRTYQNRLKNRNMKESLMDIYFLKEELWSRRLEELKKNKTSEWNISDLELALKSLKNNKAADPHRMINEIF